MSLFFAENLPAAGSVGWIGPTPMRDVGGVAESGAHDGNLGQSERSHGQLHDQLSRRVVGRGDADNARVTPWFSVGGHEQINPQDLVAVFLAERTVQLQTDWFIWLVLTSSLLRPRLCA